MYHKNVQRDSHWCRLRPQPWVLTQGQWMHFPVWIHRTKVNGSGHVELHPLHQSEARVCLTVRAGELGNALNLASLGIQMRKHRGFLTACRPKLPSTGNQKLWDIWHTPIWHPNTCMQGKPKIWVGNEEIFMCLSLDTHPKPGLDHQAPEGREI